MHCCRLPYCLHRRSGSHYPSSGLGLPNWSLRSQSLSKEICPPLCKCPFLSFCQTRLWSRYSFAGKSSVRTHFIPDQGQIPSQGIQCFSRSDPNLALKTNYQQVSVTLPLLRPLWKVPFLTCFSLASFFLAFSPSRTELIFSRGHPVSHGETYNWNPGILSLKTCSSWLFA